MGLFDLFKKKENENWVEIYSPLDGKVIDISEVPDDAFAQKMVGDGCAIEPSSTSSAIYAPIDAEIDVFETKHAVSFDSPAGLEMIVHFGIDTVTLKGEGFTTVVTTDKVKKGDKLVEFDLAFISSKVPSTRTPVIINNMDMVEKIDVVAKGQEVKAGDLIMKVLLKK